MNEEIIPPEQRTDLFSEEVISQPASTGQRLLNWLIDNILLRLVVQYLTIEFFVRLMLSLAPEYTYRVFTEQGLEAFFITYLFVILHYIVYYTICEAAFHGRTLGKLITGTKAVRNDNMPLTFVNALLRSLSRMVPFEAFSGFGYQPWHDKWTNTTVIKAR